MKLRAVLRRMLSMCPEAWYISLRSLQLCCALLLGAVVLLLAWNGDMLGRFALYRLARSFNEYAQSLLLVSVLAAVCVEDLKASSS